MAYHAPHARQHDLQLKDLDVSTIQVEQQMRIGHQHVLTTFTVQQEGQCNHIRPVQEVFVYVRSCQIEQLLGYELKPLGPVVDGTTIDLGLGAANINFLSYEDLCTLYPSFWR